jgi:hypothetical protein
MGKNVHDFFLFPDPFGVFRPDAMGEGEARPDGESSRNGTVVKV